MNFAIAGLELPVRLCLERPMTDDELFEFCTANELLRVERNANGEILVMSPTGLEGSEFNMEVSFELALWARQDGRGKVFDSNGGFTLPDGSMRSPDGAWVSKERWNALPARERERFGHLVPEFVMELRSKSDRLKDVREKMGFWIANGVEVGWLIDPLRRVVEVYRAGNEVTVYEDPSSVLGDGPVSGFELVLSRVWG